MVYELVITIETGTSNIFEVCKFHISGSRTELLNRVFKTDNWIALLNNKPCIEIEKLVWSTYMELFDNKNNIYGNNEIYRDVVKLLNNVSEAVMIHNKCKIEIFEI